jgi:hypothetical protein
MLKVIANERVIFCDIDDTLVVHGNDKNNESFTYVQVPDRVMGGKLKLRVNESMVRLVREEISRGSQIFFWSRGGFQWASDVVTALGFDHPLLKADLYVLTKPFAYFDDTDCSQWLKDRVYIGPDVPYKK